MKMHSWQEGAIRSFSSLHTFLFRSIGLTGPGVMRQMLILTTRGRKTGREVSVPLLYIEENGKLYIVASFGGNDTAPGWYKNLVANPEVEVELHSKKQRYRTRTVSAEEKDTIWPKLLALYPTYADYQKKTTRAIPVVELTAT
ncbi:MAG: nitroreductase family deazaflavin-dependent oxidoreductase [Deltaproteobacteria bacterium]|nr:nitroreductase family deazaflavin-dependent oxidoreductase [Deltaproteobacteria bacterium]